MLVSFREVFPVRALLITPLCPKLQLKSDAMQIFLSPNN
jgi:hypothetical protein